MKRSKRYNNIVKSLGTEQEIGLEEAIKIVKRNATAKFDESIEMAIRLGVDPRKSDQMVRGTVSLPHGIGKTVRVLVLAKGPKAKEAEEAGADMVGFEDYIQKIKDGWTETDVIIATPDVMSDVGKLGKLLGPKGLMPNPKIGTVTMDVGSAVKEVKAGRIEFRVDKYGILHVSVGKASFDEQKLLENTKVFIETVLRLKPASAKGQYLQSVSLSSTMSPGIKLDRSLVMAELR